MRYAEKVRLTTRKPEIPFEGMLNHIRNSLTNLVCSEEEKTGEDEEDNEADTGVGKLSEDDKPGWVMNTISKMVQQCMETFRRQQQKLDELTQPE